MAFQDKGDIARARKAHRFKKWKWRINERKNLWHFLSLRIFDDNLDKFKQCAITVLTEHDPKFELPSEKRYTAGIYKKTMKYSSEIRKGVAESLAFFGSYSDNLINCTDNKPENIVNSTVREILSDANWELWGSLDTILPILAEAAPKEFLKIVENTLQQTFREACRIEAGI
ncbi:MAG: hypothetical protein K9K76_06800 [Halanaerobiales bacterium]|nr:hypothetical protein [Halanaerobiales bacterium]